MIRRVIAAAVAVLALSFLLTTTVAAQESPAPTVAPEVVERTTTTTTAPVEVAGVTVTRGLPRTGGDIGGPAVIGLALTGAGIALAVGARRRRKHLEGA